MEWRIRTTCRAPLGLPANLAICPYVMTFPVGMFLMMLIALSVKESMLSTSFIKIILYNTIKTVLRTE
jgi:hypothetical protein